MCLDADMYASFVFKAFDDTNEGYLTFEVSSLCVPNVVLMCFYSYPRWQLIFSSKTSPDITVEAGL